MQSVRRPSAWRRAALAGLPPWACPGRRSVRARQWCREIAVMPPCELACGWSLRPSRTAARHIEGSDRSGGPPKHAHEDRRRRPLPDRRARPPSPRPDRARTPGELPTCGTRRESCPTAEPSQSAAHLILRVDEMARRMAPRMTAPGDTVLARRRDMAGCSADRRRRRLPARWGEPLQRRPTRPAPGICGPPLSDPSPAIGRGAGHPRATRRGDLAAAIASAGPRPTPRTAPRPSREAA
ncbi:MAG: hypothetical protein HMLKMBBP_02105 [Planctomycetes bacterium]|nr:hypothetical protein [Planctomycetota bacterium]